MKLLKVNSNKFVQACVHPKMVRSQFVALHRVKLTMEELLVTLIKRAQVACEESQRQRVAASNELTALHTIREYNGRKQPKNTKMFSVKISKHKFLNISIIVICFILQVGG